ncbi:hypothetical protein GCM10010234_74070 [Streptomyces hawaiiensis]
MPFIPVGEGDFAEGRRSRQGEQTARPVRGAFPPGAAPTARRPRGQAVHIGQARPAAAGDHCSRSGTDTYDGSFAGEEKVSCAPDGLCSM